MLTVLVLWRVPTQTLPPLRRVVTFPTHRMRHAVCSYVHAHVNKGVLKGKRRTTHMCAGQHTRSTHTAHTQTHTAHNTYSTSASLSNSSKRMAGGSSKRMTYLCTSVRMSARARPRDSLTVTTSVCVVCVVYACVRVFRANREIVIN